jgi:hypothetical protein
MANLKDGTDMLAIQAIAAGTGDKTNALQQVALALLVDKLQKEAKAEKDQIYAKEHQRDLIVAECKAEADRIAEVQRSCSHKKQNGMANLNGQRDHQNKLHLVCSRCGKEFTDNNLSPDLSANMDWANVGGILPSNMILAQPE